MTSLWPNGTASASVGNRSPALSEAGVLGTRILGPNQSLLPSVTPSLLWATPTWRCFVAPSFWMRNRKTAMPPSEHWSSGRCLGWPVACFQLSASREERGLPAWLPGGHCSGPPWATGLLLVRIPGLGGNGKLLTREEAAQPRTAPSSRLHGRAGQHLPDTPTRQFLVPGSSSSRALPCA